MEINMVSDNYYDLIIFSHVFEHVENDICVMKELNRIKKRWIWLFPSSNWYEVVERSEKSGFFVHCFDIKYFGKKFFVGVR